MELIEIEVSRRGIPCLWEQGGGYSNTGKAQIIASPDGTPKTAIYIARGGHLACGQHALIPVSQGDFVISLSHHRKDFQIAIMKILAIEAVEEKATVDTVAFFAMGEWDEEFPEFLRPAIAASKAKATEYHCRSPFYVIAPGE